MAKGSDRHNIMKNCMRGDKMFCAVEDYIPEILPFVHSVYCSSSFLSWGNEVLLSFESIQQGNPMGPLLFELTIYKLSAKMRSEFEVFYVDDGILGRNQENVIHDIKNIEIEAEAFGLMLNGKKTELSCKDPTSRGFVLDVLPGVCITNPMNANFLGSPIGGSQPVHACLKEKTELLCLMGDR